MAKKPDFLIIGAQKSGTTSLFKYLSLHPHISLPEMKEIHFFDSHFEQGIDWYISHFPDVEGKITGEATPYYLFHPSVPERVKTHLPHIKLIVLLRNPVERAYSHFIHAIKLKLETLNSFDHALQLESERLQSAEKMLATGEIQRHKSHKHHSYLSRGFYSEQIARWLNYFPKNQFLFIQSEDLFNAPQEYTNTVFQFLELPPIYPRQFEIHNKAVYPQLLSRKHYDNLMQKYIEDIIKTRRLTGLELNWYS